MRILDYKSLAVLLFETRIHPADAEPMGLSVDWSDLDPNDYDEWFDHAKRLMAKVRVQEYPADFDQQILKKVAQHACREP